MDEISTKFFKAPAQDEILRIEFAEPGTLARKVISRSNTRPTGRFPSMRMNKQLCWDSPAELNFMRLTECNHAVLLMQEQPCIVHYRLGGQMLRHIPDCLVKTATMQVLWEIKTLEDSRRPEILARTQFLIRHMPSHGYHYAVALAEDLRSEPRLSNARLILKFGRQPLAFADKEHARRLFNEAGSLAWQEVIAGRFAPFTLSQACRMVLDGELHLDIDQVFDGTTVLTRAAPNQLQGANHG